MFEELQRDSEILLRDHFGPHPSKPVPERTFLTCECTLCQHILGTICDGCCMQNPQWVIRNRIRVKYGLALDPCTGTPAIPRSCPFRLFEPLSSPPLSVVCYRLLDLCLLRLLCQHPASQRDEGSRVSLVWSLKSRVERESSTCPGSSPNPPASEWSHQAALKCNHLLYYYNRMVQEFYFWSKRASRLSRKSRFDLLL